MEIQKTYSGRIRLVISAVLLIAPLYIQGLWIYASALDRLSTFEDKKAYYYSHFPPFLQGNYPLLLIAFFSCAAVFILSALSLGKVKTNMKWIAYLFIVISFLVGFLSLFQMM